MQLAQTAKAQLPNQHEVDDTLGWIYYKKGMQTRAIESFENSTLKQPTNALYAYHLGLAYYKNGDTVKAKTDAKLLVTPVNFVGNKLWSFRRARA